MDALKERLRERKVLGWGVAYLAGAWLLLQVLDLVGDQFGWPGAVGRIAIVLLGVGFLAALVVGWFHGEKGEQRVTAMEIAMLTGILVLAGAAVAFVGGGNPERSAATAAADDASSSSTSAAAARSVAVLPFADMSSGKDQEYFSDGITEEILHALAQVPALRVPGRTTSFSFKGKNLPIPEIARALDVAYVLEGSVRRDGERLRITAQLVDARSDAHLWSQTYDRELRDVFAVQEEIARAIVAALEVQLGGTQRRGLVRQPTEDLEAYNLYLQGRHFWNQRGPAGLERAMAALQQAVARDPDFALAHASIAETFMLLPIYADVQPDEAARKAMQAALRALELDSSLAEAHEAIGILHLAQAEWDAAEQSFRRAIELDPRYAPAHYHYCYHLQIVDRLDEALTECRRSLALDPHLLTGNMMLANTLFALHRYDEALAQIQHVVAIDSTYGLGRTRLAYAHARAGEFDRALAESERLLAQPGRRSTMELAWLGHAFGVARRADRARAVLAELERRAEAGEFVSPVAPALVRMAVGEDDAALRLIEKAVRERAYYVQWLYLLARDPGFDRLRTNPRFQAILRGLGLER